MKNIYLALLISLFSFFALPANSFGGDNLIDKRLYLGGGFGLGFFSPGQVNNYLSDYWASKKDGYLVISEEGSPKIHANFGGRLHLKFYITKAIAATAVLEGAFAPKILTVNGETEALFFNRLSPGILFNYHHNVGHSGRYSFLLGGGVLYHRLKFNGFNGRAPGIKVNAGFNMNFKFIEVSPVISYDYVNVKTGKYWTDHENLRSHEMELNYSGIFVGLDIAFGIF